MNEEKLDIAGDSSAFNVTVDDIVQMLKSQTEEVQKLDQRKWNLEGEVEHLRKVWHYLELEKGEIDDDIAKLRLRNVVYQKEHTNLRNSIKVAKFQIEKIKESIAVAKANDLKALEGFEKTVDEITEKFRSGPFIYDRKILLEKIEKEKEKRDLLIQKLEEVEMSYENFNRAKGLRARRDSSEELLHCISPGSELSCLLEMTKTLKEVISGIKNLTGDSNQDQKKFQDSDLSSNNT